jgi:4-hydroxy-tetrahydrodipicolinate synthase
MPALLCGLSCARSLSMKLEGIYVPLITPFRPDFSLDFDAYARAIDWQIDNGVHGIIVGGSTGEYFAMNSEERVRQLQFAAQHIGGRVPLIAGVNDLLAQRCYALTAAAREAGADALLVAAPPYALPGPKDLAAHCRKIDRIADLPIILYNYPARTGVCMGEDFLSRATKIANICAIKDSSGDIGQIHLLARKFPRLVLCAGAEDLVLEFFAWGARSWVSVIANFMPREAIRLYEACAVRGDFGTGRQAMQALLPLMLHLERGGTFLQSVKHACELMRRPGGPVRPPLAPLGKTQRNNIAGVVRQAQKSLARVFAS